MIATVVLIQPEPRLGLRTREQSNYWHAIRWTVAIAISIAMAMTVRYSFIISLSILSTDIRLHSTVLHTALHFNGYCVSNGNTFMVFVTRRYLWCGGWHWFPVSLALALDDHSSKHKKYRLRCIWRIGNQLDVEFGCPLRLLLLLWVSSACIECTKWNWKTIFTKFIRSVQPAANLNINNIIAFLVELLDEGVRL